MPYICLANRLIPDGTVQILDLKPNASLHVPGVDPLPPQTAYICQAQNEPVALQDDGTISDMEVHGLQAYLLDRVEPGGLEQAAGTITVVGANTGDTVTVNGVVFTAVAGGADASAQEFDDLATATTVAAVATSLAATINHAASVTLMKAESDSGADYAAASADDEVITLVAKTGAADDLLGADGCFISLETSEVSRFTLSGDRLARLHDTWTRASLAATAAAILARVDAGQSLEATDLDAVLTAQVGSDFGTASRSTGDVEELLSILAGRGYRITRFVPGTHTLNYYMDETHPDFLWDDTQRGSFTYAVKVYGTGMHDGEIRPSAIGGDTVYREVRPIRTILETDSFTLSATGGTIATFRKAAGAPPVTLWPESGDRPHFPWHMQPGFKYTPVPNARVVTVYNADGSLWTA